MINLEGVVNLVILLLIAGAVFGLLYFLVNYIGGKIPGAAGQLFVTIAKIVLVVLAVLLLIGVLVSLVKGGPMFQWGANPVIR